MPIAFWIFDLLIFYFLFCANAFTGRFASFLRASALFYVVPSGYRSYFLKVHCVLTFGFLIFYFDFLLTIGTERIARYMAEFPRCALYISGRKHYLLMAYYSLAFFAYTEIPSSRRIGI